MGSRNGFNRREFMELSAGGALALYLDGCATPPRSASGSGRAVRGPVDPKRWAKLAQIALEQIRSSGCSYGDIRLIETETQSVDAQDRRISGVTERFDGGFGIRALFRGAWGFAAGTSFSPAELRSTANRAVEVARAGHTLIRAPVKLADEPIHVDKVVTPFAIDPFSVPLEDKCDLLVRVCDILHEEKEVIRSNGRLWAQRDIKHFASTEGTVIDFELLATGGRFGATARKDDDYQSREFVIPCFRAGYEHIMAHDPVAQAPRVAAQAVDKVHAREPTAGIYDLVLDPAHLALTIHETCGHATELDRALGYEANYAGTSFLTPDMLGKFRYGSKQVNLVADNRRPGALASTGYDDEGVSGQRWAIIDEGVFSGYSTGREVASTVGHQRSRGSCRADGWHSVPIVRMANVGLEPGEETLESLFDGVKNGIYIEGYGSFSIDQRRLNFQFGGDAFWEIRNGKRGSMLKKVVYGGITPEFWRTCDGVADRGHWRQYGFVTCGKGQPNQSGWMTHAASPARFRKVNVIDAKG